MLKNLLRKLLLKAAHLYRFACQLKKRAVQPFFQNFSHAIVLQGGAWVFKWVVTDTQFQITFSFLIVMRNIEHLKSDLMSYHSNTMKFERMALGFHENRQ